MPPCRCRRARRAARHVEPDRARAPGRLPELGELFEELRPFEEAHDSDSFEAGVIRVARRDYEKAVRVPPELQRRADPRRLARLPGLAARARGEGLRDHAARISSTTSSCAASTSVLRGARGPVRRRARRLRAGNEDGGGRGDLRPAQGGARADAARGRRRPPVDDSCLHGRFSHEAQRRFSLSMLRGVGDGPTRRGGSTAPCIRSRCRCRERGHPADDELPRRQPARDPLVPARVRPRALRAAGRAAVRAHVARHGVSSAFHESQSRHVGEPRRPQPVHVEVLLPAAPAGDPGSSAPCRSRQFHRALNKVQPTLRRVDADEVTYCLHIILRFEIERECSTATSQLRDLPDAFDAKMARVPRAAAAGPRERRPPGRPLVGHELRLLPDVRSSATSSPCSSGSARSADLGDLDEQFERGEFTPLAQWLGEHVHRHGRRVQAPGADPARRRRPAWTRRRISATSSASSSELFGAAIA